MVSNATRAGFEAASDFPQSYVLINNTLPETANHNLSLKVDGVTYANSTADSKGFVSFNYTGNWSKHTFEFVMQSEGNLNLFDFAEIVSHFGEETSQPYPNYDLNTDGIVDVSDVVLFAKQII